MSRPPPPEHFQGKAVADHLKDARMKGAQASTETHGPQLPGPIAALLSCIKEISAAFLILYAILAALIPNEPLLFPLFACFGLGLIIWETGRSAIRGWGKLERLHRVIEEERWEIEHHREQEKEELTEMYAAKGFEGKLLEEVINVLMADDNRLLRVMLEEELGLSLEVYEHPLKQATGAFFGSLIASSCLLLSLFFWPILGLPITAILLIGIASFRSAKLEKRRQIYSMVWNIALLIFASSATYFLAKALS